MNTIYAGKQLLQHLEKKRGAKIESKTFFDKEFWPTMFNAPDHQHLMQVHNSDFFQGGHIKSAKKEDIALPLFRKMKYELSLKKVAEGTKPVSASIGVGFMAGGPAETTFGQVTDLPLKFTEDELLCSWFGGALGIGFGGGYDFLTSESEIFEFIYNGWPYYRRLIQETPGLKGRQIEAWNGLWLCYGLKYRNDLEKAYRKVMQPVLDKHISTNKNIAKLERPEWSKQVLSLSAEFGGADAIVLQGYSYGSTNKTLGSMPVQLPQVKRFSQLFKQFVEQEKGLENQALEDVFKEEFSMSKAARYGQLGLRALTPAKLPNYLYDKDTSLTKIQKDEQKNPYQFLIYKTWIIAMLNNEELYELATELAKKLLEFKEEGKNAMFTEADKKKHIEALFTMRKPSLFINQLSEIAQGMVHPPEQFRQASKAAATQITPDQLHLFISLLRFEYIYHLNQNES